MKEYTNYLETKNLAKSTQKEYILKLNSFLIWLAKEEVQVTKNDVLNYLEHLKDKKNNKNSTRAIVLIAIRTYFTFLLKNDYILTNPTSFLKIRGTQTKKLYHTYSNEELDTIYDDYYNFYIRNFEPSKYWSKHAEELIILKRERNHTILGILIYQGVQTGELKNIKLDDVDLRKAAIKISSTHQAKERILSLNAVQIGTLINYIQNVRHKLTTTHTDLLFDFESHNYNDIIKHLTHQLKKIDINFINFRQIRSSVITNWIKTENLRKAQYLAGHRNIYSTECYLQNNLDSLIKDIAKHHPFTL